MVENITILHKNEREIKKDVNGAIQDGWTVLGDSMFGYEKDYLDIPNEYFESFKSKYGNDFEFIKCKSGYQVLYTRLTRVVPDNKTLIKEIFGIN